MSKRLRVRASKRRKTKKTVTLALFLILIVLAGYLIYPKFIKGNKLVQEVFSPSKEEKPKLKIVDLNSKSRPYAVMINNINVARKYQRGLQDAYIIYELIAEGGITRMLALFKDQTTDVIGTVRSARHYYLDYVLENDAIYTHWGWSPQAESDIKSLGIDNINGLKYSTKYFWKDTSLNVSTEHTAYTSMEKMAQGAKDLGYKTETNKDLLFNYSVDEIDLSTREGAVPATSIDITYSSSTKNHYDYDPETKTYLRSVNGTPHTDYGTGKQYNFKNIIVYQISNSSIAGDSKGRQDLDNIGEGTGYFITNGYAVPIKWTKKSRSSQTVYSYNDGEEITLNDGNCFIQIQPKGQTLNIS